MLTPMFTKAFVAIAVLALFASLLPVAQAVTVGPVRLEYAADPGDIIRGEMFLQNEIGKTQTFYPSFEKFTEDSTGQKNFTKETSDLATWFVMRESMVLGPGESRTIPFTINVPKNAPPGGHFAVIWWSSSPPGGAGQVAIVTRAGVLVYLTVSGDIREEGSVEDFHPSSRFLTKQPFEFTAVFHNTGNSYLKPVGTLQLKNLFGGVAAEAAVNEFGSNVFPAVSKNFTVALAPEGFFFGPYRAVLDLSYGSGEHPQTVREVVWVLVIPWSILIGLLVLLFLIFFVIPRGIRRYNAWIIAQAKGK